MPANWTPKELLQLGTPSAELKTILSASASQEKPPISYMKGNLDQLRKGVAATRLSRWLPPPSHIKEVDENIIARDGAALPIRIYSPADSPPSGSPMAVNFHGGGWILGGLESTFLDLRPLVTEFKAVVVDVGYRLSPEHPFPTPVNDCWDALQWAAKNAAIWNADPEVGFIVAGNSAGANLAAVATVLARDNQLSPLLTGCCLTALPAMLDENIPDKYRPQWLSFEQNKEAPGLNGVLIDFIHGKFP